MTQYGWVCPLCGKVNAPWVASCDCVKKPGKSHIGNPITGTITYLGDTPYTFTATSTANKEQPL
ncbi:MAG: hypothetical protein WC565_08835 [Parcubacteria group bacterium]